jgi:integrase
LRSPADEALVLADIGGQVRHPERFSRTFRYRLAAARKRLGEDAVPEIRLHDLRHTHATLLLTRRVASDATAGGIRRIA